MLFYLLLVATDERSWRRQGVEVVLSSEELNEAKDITTLLQNAQHLDKVTGIYMLIAQSTDKANFILNNVDIASRSLGNQLRYFLVASSFGCFGAEICLSRVKTGLVAKCLDISSVSKHCAVEIIEHALHSSHVLMSARTKPVGYTPLLKQIAAIADIDISGKTNPEDTLKKLGMLDEKIPAICSFLNTTKNIYLDEDEVSLLTINSINDMEDSVIDVSRPKYKGLSTFFQKVCSDELVATTDVAMLPTLHKDLTLSKTEFDVNLRYLCIVPGMEGHPDRFHTMCDRLKLPALVLQPGLDHPRENVQETAQRLATILFNKGMAQNKFCILGYESGIMIALEIAAILENHGLVGTVFCVGCEPAVLKEELEQQLKDFKTEEQLQNELICHMFKLFTENESADLDNALVLASTWTQKLDACVRHLLGNMRYSTQYARALIETALARIEQVRCYQASGNTLRSQIVFLRAVTEHASLKHMSMQRYSEQPVLEYQLESDLSNIANDTQCASIINKHLDADTINTFESRNHCETYHVNEYVSFR